MVERAVPIIPGSDIRAMKEFYVDKLGFELAWEDLSEDNDVDGLMGIKRGDIVITIDCPMMGHGRNACVSLEVEDADRYYNAWKGNVQIETPPANQWWGGRTFTVHDPAGNTIFVIGPVVE
jgi:catechol 2,3-dioxygenase-like lactoylglutathione lyase family enzyme